MRFRARRDKKLKKGRKNIHNSRTSLERRMKFYEACETNEKTRRDMRDEILRKATANMVIAKPGEVKKLKNIKIRFIAL